jgi:hypothetical protein
MTAEEYGRFLNLLLEGTARRQLEVMYRSHLENVRLCEAEA